MNEIKRLKPIMFVGTASDVGKSLITAGFCRIFKQDGYLPAPFKAQNMSLNSFATPEGFEIGRAQAVQAEAAMVPCHTDMNPVLIKPTSDTSSQIILHGKPIGNMSARDYFKKNGKDGLFTEVTSAFQRLSDKYSPIVMEGAGSISELNLKDRDIANMRMAIAAGACTYLIADIDRGGVFASLYGTMALLTEEEKNCIKGIIINKFRGDSSLFEDGRKMIEQLCGVPVVGVLPFMKDIRIEEEDSVSLKNKKNTAVSGLLNIAVVLFSRLSNFTDFARLENEPQINLYYTSDKEELKRAEVIILPGSKNTIEDLNTIKENGIADLILEQYQLGKMVIGICGGYQMLGKNVADPFGVESDGIETSGIGLLPITTILQKEKITKQCEFQFLEYSEKCSGYEIHMGETNASEPKPVSSLSGGGEDGYFLNNNCWGTYLHGILDNQVVINHLLESFSKTPRPLNNYQDVKSKEFDKLAAVIREHVDMDQIYISLTL